MIVLAWVFNPGLVDEFPWCHKRVTAFWQQTISALSKLRTLIWCQEHSYDVLFWYTDFTSGSPRCNSALTLWVSIFSCHSRGGPISHAELLISDARSPREAWSAGLLADSMWCNWWGSVASLIIWTRFATYTWTLRASLLMYPSTPLESVQKCSLSIDRFSPFSEIGWPLLTIRQLLIQNKVLLQPLEVLLLPLQFLRHGVLSFCPYPFEHASEKWCS